MSRSPSIQRLNRLEAFPPSSTNEKASHVRGEASSLGREAGGPLGGEVELPVRIFNAFTLSRFLLVIRSAE
jgi:hypothetical protein